jgi:hypothetical protein
MTGNITRLLLVARGYIRKQIDIVKLNHFQEKSTLLFRLFMHIAPANGSLLQMEAFLLGKELIHGFLIHFVWYAAIHRAYRGALGFFMEPLTFSAFIGDYIVNVHTDGGIALAGVYDRSVEQAKRAFDAGAICKGPFYAAFINRIIGTFRFASPAIDTFFRYFNSHNFQKLGSYLNLFLQSNYKYRVDL